MKKDLALHFLASLCLIIPVFLLRYLNIHDLSANLIFLQFLLGAIIGTLLPDIDHLIYVYFLRPQELTSQRVMYEAQKGNLAQGYNLLSSTVNERTNLILHTVFFQVLFVILSFLVVTSSASLLGRGLVITFLLHLLVDELLDKKTDPSLSLWFKNIPFRFDSLQLNIYLVSNFIIILIFGFLM